MDIINKSGRVHDGSTGCDDRIPGVAGILGVDAEGHGVQRIHPAGQQVLLGGGIPVPVRLCGGILLFQRLPVPALGG
jgi:hypothetical protein